MAPVSEEPGIDEPIIYVNAIPRGGSTDLMFYVAALMKTVATTFGVEDPRFAPKDSPLAYGQWKGALAALARETPPSPQVYHLVTTDEPATVVADALFEFVAARGVR